MTVRSFPFAEQESGEDDYARLHVRETGVISGLNLTLTGLTWSLSTGAVMVGGFQLVVEDAPETGSSAPTAAGAANPRRDMLVARRTLDPEASSSVVLVLKQGAPAAAPVDPVLTRDTVGVFEEPLYSWQVPGNGGTVGTAVRDLRRAVGAYWVDYQPLWTATDQAPVIGNGSLRGRLCKVGDLCTVKILLRFGSTSAGGRGDWRFSLPFPAASDGFEHYFALKAFTAAGDHTGYAYALPGGTELYPYLPRANETSEQDPVRNAAPSGATGTGRPLVSGAYTFQPNLNHNLAIWGAYETGS